MEERKNHIDAQLQEKFQDFSPQVPFEWNQMSEALDKNGSKRRVVLWAAVVAVVITSISGLVLEMSDVDQVNYPNSFNQKSTSSLIVEAPIGENKKVKSTETDIVKTKGLNEIQPLQNTRSSHDVEANKNIQNTGRLNVNGLSTSLSILASNTEENTTKSSSTSNDYKMLTEELSSRSLEALSTSDNDNLQLFQSISIPQRPWSKNRKWAFGVGYDQNQTALDYNIIEDYRSYVHKNYLTRMSQGEFALAAPQLQGRISYEITPALSLGLGLGFTQTKTSQSFNFRDSIPVSVAQGETPDIYGNYPIFGYLGLGQQINYEGVQTISMLSVPLSVSYRHPINRLWSLNAEGTAAFNLLTSSTGKTLNYHNLSLMDLDTEKLRSSIWSARFGIGVDRRMSIREYIGMRLNAQGAFTPLYKRSSAVENRPWSVGLSVFYTIKLF